MEISHVCGDSGQFRPYVDLEGRHFSRHGILSIIAIFVHETNKAYFVDMHTLGATVFAITDFKGVSLRTIFESGRISKVFSDMHNDSDAFFAHFNIRLHGVEDLQLMANATHPLRRRRFLGGLANCIQYDLDFPFTEITIRKMARDKGRNLFAPEKGGSYDVLDQRPITSGIITYCASDVLYFPRLRRAYLSRLDRAWQLNVEAESQATVEVSQSPTYLAHGEHKKIGPWTK